MLDIKGALLPALGNLTYLPLHPKFLHTMDTGFIHVSLLCYQFTPSPLTSGIAGVV